jgi:hypothetical protein
MNDTLEKAPAPTQEIVKANIQLELTKSGLIYQSVLQSIENIVVREDNLVEAQKLLEPAERAKKFFEKRENPHKKAWQEDNAATKSLLTPLEEGINRKKAEIARVNKILLDREAAIKAEQAKQVADELAANNFFIQISQQVAAAVTDFEIVRIEKLIGAHSSKPLYKEKAEALKPIISKQKEHIRHLEAIKEQEKKAEQRGDDEEIMQLREQQQEITAKISEGNEAVQFTAIKGAESNVVVPEVVAPQTVKPKRQIWTWELVDIEQAKKKADWTKTVTNDAVIDEHLKSIKDSAESEDFVVSGIRFFVKKSY